MPQRITVKEITHKPTAKGGTYVSITADNGAKLSCFDANLTSVQPGAVLDVEIEVQGKWSNIKTWTLVSQGQPQQTAPMPPPEKPDYSKRDEQINLNVAINAAVELRCRIGLDDLTDNENRVWETALEVIANRLGVLFFQEPQKTAGKAPLPTQQAGATAKPPASDAPAPTTGTTQGTATLKTSADLWRWGQSKGLSVADLRQITGQLGPTGTKNLTEDYTKVVAELKKRHEAKQEVKS